METDLDTIHIFETNIGEIARDSVLFKKLDENLEILEWSIDCEDVDCVLRVVSETLLPDDIIKIITDFGFDCQEMS